MVSNELFRPHGSLAVYTEGRVLVVRAQGPWNLELTKQYADEVPALVASLAGAPWALLGVIVGEGIHSAESFALQVDIVREHRPLGRVASAVVLENVEFPRIVADVFRRMYAEAEEPHAFFDDRESALCWLNEQIAAFRGA